MQLKETNKKHLNDLYELANNLDDDLTLDLEKGEFGYKTHEKSYYAVKTYTLEVLKKMIKKMEIKLGIK